MADASPTSDKDPSSRVTSEFSITDCSICLEQLRKPKSLPCLHTFCQDCLSTFITTNNTAENTPVFFNCPVCRRKTIPIEPCSAHDLWASQFPTNNFVVEVIKKLNPNDTKQHFCHLCLQRDNKETPASCWCQDCEHFQCENCNTAHKIVLFQHKTISIEELSQRSAVLIPVQSNCDKHGKHIELICLDHELLCCHICIAIDHRKCDNVSTVLEYADTLKSKEKSTELAKDIDKNVNDIDAVIFKLREKFDEVTNDKDTALQQISDVRKWLDTQMSEMSEEVMKTYKIETEKIQRTLDDMETVKSSLLQTKAMSNTTQQTGQEHQLVSTVLRGKSEIERCNEIIQNNQDETVRIHLKLLNEFDKIMKENLSICTVGVSKRVDSRHKQTTKKMFSRAAKQVGTITIPDSSSCIRGILVLPNGHLLVSYHSGQQLMLITESGEVLSKLELDGRPWDMCQMPDGDVAVSVYGSKKISIVRLSSSLLSLVRNIQLSEKPYGITFYDGALHITTAINKLYRVSGNEKLLQPPKLMSLPKYLSSSTSGSHLYGSVCENSQENPAVYRVSRDNTYTEVIKADIVKGARGIVVDDEDNIYVCGYVSNNVVQISADGSKMRELLTSNDVNQPFVLTVCGEKMYICENGKQTIKVYELE